MTKPASGMTAVDELAQARETIRTLNRRCQSAEAGLAVKLDEMQRAGVSFGRGLANHAASMYLAQRDDLLTFAGEVLVALRDNVGVDWDGGDAQDAMVRCGLLKEVEATEPCGESCACADACCAEWPMTCYRFTDLGSRAVAAHRLASHVSTRGEP